MGVLNRLMHGWNAFRDGDKRSQRSEFQGFGSYSGGWGNRPDRSRMSISNERSIIASIYTRLSVDCAGIVIRHARVDSDGRFLEQIKSGLNDCLNVEANIDQGGSAFRQSMYMTLFDKGTIAVVPVDIDVDPEHTSGYDIRSLRVGEIVDWYPQSVLVSLYNDQTGKREEIEMPKRLVAVVENPFYAVMNENNSTLQRLIRKLNILDQVDEAAGSGKLDLIVQLPYTIKTPARKEEAEKRRADIEMQLKGSKYGIAYTDGTERITQLNRPAENNMLKQIEFLTNMLYGQLGTSKEVFDGTADEATMLNYNNRTVEAIVRAVTEAFARTFLTKTGRTQGQAIVSFRDPFKLVPISEIANISDKLTRNEIATSNEMRAIFGWMPSKDPKADELRNKNIPAPVEDEEVVVAPKRKAVEKPASMELVQLRD